MSHIFDALQRSEAERSGLEISPDLVITELLQAVEKQVAAGNATTAEDAMVDPIAAEISSASEPPARVPELDQLQPFKSLKVAVHADSKLVCLTDKESLAAEKFRFLAVRLRQIQHSRPMKKVLVTSTIPQEGKSTVAANLACTLARRAQQKTLLIEGDLRRPSLGTSFGLGAVPGLCQWLQGEGGPEKSIYHLEGTGLWILPAGSSPKNPLELMQAGRLAAIMDQLTNWFDWVVIDSPPILPLADTSIWSRLADGILLVTRQGTTQRKHLQRGLEALDQTKIIGALINNSSTVAHSDYYYHYGPSGKPGVADNPEPQPIRQ